MSFSAPRRHWIADAAGCIRSCILTHYHRGARRVTARLLVVQFVVATCFLLQPTVAAPAKELRRVLVFNDLGSISSPGFARMDQAIFSALENSPYQIEFYNENLETTLFPEEAQQHEFREGYIRKYRDHKPDVIIAIGEASLSFMLESHEKSFPNTPVIFCGSVEEMLYQHQLTLDSHFTGVWAVPEPRKTFEMALQLLPGTRHVVVVGGTGLLDRQLEAVAKKSLRDYESKLDFTYLTDLDMPTLLERLRHLPKNTIVYYTAILRDAAGGRFIDATQSVPMVASAANAPVFVMDDVDIGQGTVGGDVVSWAAQGRLAAAMAMRVLNGQKPQDIPITKVPDIYMFDWRALQRWGLRERDLPPGSVVLYRQPTLWQAYKRYVIAVALLLAGETLLIFALLWQRQKRMKAEAVLRESENRLAGIVGSAMDAIITIDDKQRIVLFNASAEKIFGCSAKEAIGTDMQRFIPERFRSEHRIHIQSFGESGITKRTIDALGGLWAVRENGQEFPIEASISRLEAGGKMLFTVTIRDITERRQAEEAVRESEARFELVANTAPVLIWMSGLDKGCTYFNQTWLAFTGRPLAAELGNGWAEGVHPEDIKNCMATYSQAFDRHQPFTMEYRLRRHDGEYRWVLDTGVARFHTDSSFAGYIGSAIDVTERKLAEEALAGIGGRLIEAQERERAHIARELHDDINQQLALIVIELDQLRKNLPKSLTQPHSQVEELRTRTIEISSDVQALSHRLHSSKLEYLGLAMAVQGFCREFSDQHQVEVNFSYQDVPDSLPQEISLCLFRVLQGALTNAVKHSGVKIFEARLTGTTGGIHLIVRDAGAGFDLEEVLSGHGIGLISMRERVRLVNGRLSIQSKVNGGTTIEVEVPLLTSRNKSKSSSEIVGFPNPVA